MSEQEKDEPTMNNSVVTFDTNALIILTHLNKMIENIFRKEEFLGTVPKLRCVKWVPTFYTLKNCIQNEIEQEISSMWENENMGEKLDILEKQKKKFAEMDPNKTVWRPQLNDVKGQLRAFDVANLRKQKALLTPLAQETEEEANTLKQSVTAKRLYLKALIMDIKKYQKKNEQLMSKIQENILEKEKFVKSIAPNVNIHVNDTQLSLDLEEEK